MLLRYDMTKVSAPASPTACRCCQSQNLFCFQPLRLHSPANMYLRPMDATVPQPAFPLDTTACSDCGMIQSADQILLDSFGHHPDDPSGATTRQAQVEGLAEVFVQRAMGGLIVGVGCGNGLLLAAANKKGARALGVDPALGIAALARQRGVSLIEASFTHEIVSKHVQATVVSAVNAFDHIGDLQAFMEAVDWLLSSEGTFVIEVPWAAKVPEGDRFDSLCHERVSGLSLLSVKKLVDLLGMDIVDAERLAAHGGPMRVFVQRMILGTRPTDAVTDMLSEEREAGLTERETWVEFAERAEAVGYRLPRVIDQVRGEGLTVAGCGASARGNTLLTYCGLGPDRIDFLVDRSPLKQNLFCPNTLIPVRPPEAIGRSGRTYSSSPERPSARSSNARRRASGEAADSSCRSQSQC